MSSDNKLQERLEALENEVRELKINKVQEKDSKVKKEKKEKKPRAPTEYNKFVSNYINEQKELLGKEKFNHKVAFTDAALKWKEVKGNKEVKEVTETIP